MNERKEPTDSKESPESDPPRMKRFVHFILKPEIAIPLIVVMLLFAAPFAYRSYRINQLPDIDHPFDLETFLNFEVPDEENAYAEYRQAVNKLVNMKGIRDYDAEELISQDGWSKATPTIRDWLEDNQAALAIWKEGTQKPNAQYIPYREMTRENDFTIIFEIRDLIDLIQFQIMKLQHEKKYTEAWEWNRALFRFSRHVGKNGGPVERLNGIVALYFANNAIRKWVQNPAVDAVMLKKALEEIETDYGMTSDIIRVMKAEYALSEKFLRILDFTIEPFSDSEFESFASRWLYYFHGDPDMSLRLLKHAYTNWFTQIEKPRYLQTERFSDNTNLFQLEAKHRNILIPPEKIREVVKMRPFGMIFVGLDQNRSLEGVFLREQARYHCLRIAIATEIHLREHGSYPDKLEELKDTLSEIPYDPFFSASKRNLQYRKENDGYVVWSVGEDEKDELGGNDGRRTDQMAGDDIGFRLNKNKPEKKQSKK